MLLISDAKRDILPVNLYGGKAHGLYLLAKNGYPIPETIAIQATADIDDINNVELQKELHQKLSPFAVNGMFDLAVRSSCTLEDDYTNSMAGHFTSILGTMSFEDILTNIKNVIKGLEKVSAHNGKMGIVIQPKVNADYSGVLFSSDPISYSKKQMVITYTNGIGDKLVSGEASGTDVIIKIKDGECVSDDIMDEPFQTLLYLLAQKSKQLEDILKYPLDIEWAIAGSVLYFLQCRPLTSITATPSVLCAVNKQNLSSLPAQLVSHDKIKLRLTAQEANILISDAYVCIRNTCNDPGISLDISKSNDCRGYSAVIIYPQRLSNKVIRSFVGDKMKVFGSITDCCRYGIRSFPEYEGLTACLAGYSEKLDSEYWISATIIQEIFDPLYTGVIQRIPEGFIIEITRGHFLTKGVVPTSQYIVSNQGYILEKNEIQQRTWLKIIEGHVIYCVCNNGDESLVSLRDIDIKNIIQCFNPVLKTDSNVVEFGLLQQTEDVLKPYLIDFVDDNSPINISSADIKSGIISYGSITGKPIVVEKIDADSLNEHFHNTLSETTKSNEKIIFICKNPELALLALVNQYEPQNIGFVFENCAVGAHMAVILREKGIPAIRIGSSFYTLPRQGNCTVDAKTPGLLPKERLKYE